MGLSLFTESRIFFRQFVGLFKDKFNFNKSTKEIF